MAEPYIGEIRTVGFDFAPYGWLDCDGRLYPVGQYVELASVIGNRYGGDGKSTFAVPNLQDLAALGQGQGPNLSPYKVGDTGGADRVTLDERQLPSHTHQGYSSREPADLQAPGPDRSLARSTPGNAYQGEVELVKMDPQVTSAVGSGQSHNNMPPSLVLRFCICHRGVFPNR